MRSIIRVVVGLSALMVGAGSASWSQTDPLATGQLLIQAVVPCLPGPDHGQETSVAADEQRPETADRTDTGRRPLEALTVLALAPLDGRAVVRLPGGELLVVEVDDPLPRTAAVVVKVLADRLVVEEEVGGEPARRRQVWIFKPEKLGARSRVVVLDPTPPPLPPVTKPRIITLDPGDPVTEEKPSPKADAQ